MNTTTRIVNQSALSRDWIVSIVLSKQPLLMILLTTAVLMSSLSVVYLSFSVRNLHANIQQTIAERRQLHVEWQQLLLEKSTWVMQARVQKTAESDLGMMIPDNKSVVIVNE